MKNKVLFLASMAIFGATALKAQLNVGATTAPVASAILQATSTTKGFLPPVMTGAQEAAIVTPAAGLTVFNSTSNQLEVNIGTTTTPIWVSASSATTYTTTSQAILKSNANMSGGGNVSFLAGNLLWTSRFIVIGEGYGSQFSTNGFFDITMPAVGTVITGVGGASNVTTTALGINITNYEALYYILPIGSSYNSVPANFRIVSITSAYVLPESWVLVGLLNGDNNMIKLGTGQGSNWNYLGNTGTLPGTNFIGTTDNSSLSLRTNGTERMRIDSTTGNVGIGTTTPYAPLQLANTIMNRKIVLFDGGTSAGNDSTFYGFGVNSSTLRYQVPTTASHSFYVNKNLSAQIGDNGHMTIFGFDPAYYFNDRTRSNRTSALFTNAGISRLWGSQNGDLLTVDSIGNAAVIGKLNIGNIPVISSGNLLTTDVSGNVGQTSLPSVVKPTVIGVGAQNGISSIVVNTSSSNQYTGWTVTIPSLSKYLLQVNMLLLPNTTYTSGSSMFLRTSFSTTQPTFTAFQGTYGVAGGPILVGAAANVNNNYQMMTGSIAINNTTTSPLVLYYFVINTVNAGGYTGSVSTGLSNTAAAENSIVGIPIN